MAEIRDVLKKYGFMYEVNDEIYHMGQGVFERATEPFAIEYFLRYREEVKRIGRENIQPYKLEKDEYENLIYYYRKVMLYSDLAADGNSVIRKNGLLRNFVDELPAEDATELLEQIEDFQNVFWYYNRVR